MPPYFSDTEVDCGISFLNPEDANSRWVLAILSLDITNKLPPCFFLRAADSVFPARYDIYCLHKYHMVILLAEWRG